MTLRLERIRRRASAYLNAGDYQAAAKNLESLLAENPGDDAARLDLALLRMHQGRYREAHQLTMRACERDPGNPALLRTRLEALAAFHEHAVMQGLAQRVSPSALDRAEDLAAIADALESFGDTSQATQWIQQAQLRAPADPVIQVKRAWIDHDSGRFEDAERELIRVVAGPRPVPLAHWLLSRLRRQSADAHHVERLQALLLETVADPASQACIGFALYKELNDLGRHADAWSALQTACAAKRRTLNYDAQETGHLFDRVIATFDHDRQIAASDLGGASATPIFIVGMFRSGTTLLERILGTHPQVAAGGESQRLSAQLRLATDCAGADVLDEALLERAGDIHYADLGRRYLDAHEWLLQGRSHFTEKLPSNFQLIGFVQRALPQAKILHLVRDPMDTCWSNLTNLFGGVTAAYSYDQTELADYHRQYQRLMQHWHRQFPGLICDVPYVDLISQPEDTARRVMAFCGLPWVEGCTAIEKNRQPVRTASAEQVRQPIHGNSLGRWKPYAEWLRPLQEVLLPNVSPCRDPIS